MQASYQPHAIEAAAQAHWQSRDAYRVVETPGTPKFYACSMLPYPSGRLHMGHVRNYVINDILARQRRMQGFNVLMPMGWDAFGLPAENAAIASGQPPAAWTRANIADMKAQMRPLGLAIDWSRELTTCDPAYYCWNQWFFLKLLERGVVYRRTQVVNWDPVDQTVLANEQVVEGRGWRSGALIERREIPGYYLAITSHAAALLDGLDTLDAWPPQVLAMQRNWIGRSEGTRVAFQHEIRDADGASISDGQLWVFTTRVDTLMGVTFCAVAPEHPLAQHAASRDPTLAALLADVAANGLSGAELAKQDKRGIHTGLHVQHPLTGEEIPVWIGRHVLMSYGDGAVMGVPAHDARDFAFAHANGIPVRQVVQIDDIDFDTRTWHDAYANEDGVLTQSGRYDGLRTADARAAIHDALSARGRGERTTTWRLRDWSISRQRYWGTPIPIIHCAACGPVPVPLDQLPVVLPTDCVPDGTGNPLQQCDAFVRTTCPACGADARRETDTMDTFVDSSWYFMRYACVDADDMVDTRAHHWLPVDQYIGGIEHAVLHLLYARFWTRVMHDMGLVDIQEPFARLFTQGMLLNASYYRDADNGKRTWYYPEQVNIQHDTRGQPITATLKADGLPVCMGGLEKMSKSKNNVVEPGPIIARHGADTARLYAVFAGPPAQSAVWSDAGVEGAARFLRRLWSFAHEKRTLIRLAQETAGVDIPLSTDDATLRHTVHRTLEQILTDYERLQYNTVVSGAMKLLNAMEAWDGERMDVLCEAMGITLRVLQPVTPHIAHALWCELGYAGDIIDAPWPAVDAAALQQSLMTLAVQVNGRLRGEIQVPSDADHATIRHAALAHADVRHHTRQAAPSRIIVVPGRLVNLVLP